jgi:hypothetical protein
MDTLMTAKQAIAIKIAEQGFPTDLACSEARAIVDQFIEKGWPRARVHFPGGETAVLYRSREHAAPVLESAQRPIG